MQFPSIFVNSKIVVVITVILIYSIKICHEKKQFTSISVVNHCVVILSARTNGIRIANPIISGKL